MEPIVVVGSGASGVNFALSVLEKGRKVTMLDVGHQAPPAAFPGDTFNELRTHLDDPVGYFLGERFETLILPGSDGEFYGFPPNKQFIFDKRGGYESRATGFSPLISFAAGGLAETWTGGCYPFNDAELADFPFDFAALAPFYERISRRIGVAGIDDDMSRFFPLHGGLLEPLDLDEHSRLVLDTYERRKDRLNGRENCYLGRARSAVLSRELNGRKACGYLGRCLWSCPTESLYTPSITLRQCRAHENFEYVSGVRVDHFHANSNGRIDKVVARSVDDGGRREFDAGTLVLAAGTLSSSKIFLDSLYQDTGRLYSLSGLMDNRQILMPYINLRLIGRPFDPNTYQYHQIAVGLEESRFGGYVHGLVTTLKTALIHPVVQNIPTSLGTALRLFRNARAALGLANINFNDGRRDENRLTLELDEEDKETRLRIEYRPAPDEPERIKLATQHFRRILRSLGCIAPSSLVHVRPMGHSVHYAGTIPMTDRPEGPSADAACRSREFENLYFVDGTTFPSLPAKNLTFTMMANAARVAELAF